MVGALAQVLPGKVTTELTQVSVAAQPVLLLLPLETNLKVRHPPASDDVYGHEGTVVPESVANTGEAVVGPL